MDSAHQAGQDSAGADFVELFDAVGDFFAALEPAPINIARQGLFR
jgi:hypothetical protein